MPPATPSASFSSLPSEIRIKIYEQVLKTKSRLTLDDTCWPERWPEHLNISLLRTNKLIHREASPVFYGQNCLDFVGRSSEFAHQFFTTIGASNASCIRHIQINFPLLDPGSYGSALGTASNELLTSIQDACPDLRTITSTIYLTSAEVNRAYNEWTDQEIVTALQVIDTRFRASPHLQEIIVDGACTCLLGVVYSETVNSLGWRINEGLPNWGSDEYYWEEEHGHDFDWHDFEWDEYEVDFMDNDSEIGYDSDDNGLVPVDDFGFV
ncbi:hypothetical protein AAL_08388 [Moelleriella libera RCEF 2490]|uniref:F-box domain-containing protein n=1 Tax=Moelleriella libera RCEF 2490 TaxID=1081109 RepID=A0A167VG13_9HYPO|nr:hypothetical protein AAL_08388 [Moelleriella libera RCEF 2490]